MWKLNFAEIFREKGGFDVVVANPPYVSAMALRRTYPSDLLELYRSKFKSAKGAVDLYILFMERGITLMGKAGTLAYITPNKYLSASYGAALRKYCIDSINVDRFVDLSQLRVFKEASVYPILTFLSGVSNGDSVESMVPNSWDLSSIENRSFQSYFFPKSAMSALPNHLWGFVLGRNFQILEQILSYSIPFYQIAEIRATSTAKEADLLSEFITDRATSGAWRVVNTGTIDRYESLWGRKEMKNKGASYRTPYLSPCKHITEYRSEMYGGPKLIFAKMAIRAEVIVDLTGEFASINTNCIYKIGTEEQLLFLAAYCNSKLFQFVYSEYFGGSRMSGGYFQYQAPQIRSMPVPEASEAQKKEIVRLVRMRLRLSSESHPQDCIRCESRLDALFIELCGLAESEADIVLSAVVD